MRTGAPYSVAKIAEWADEAGGEARASLPEAAYFQATAMAERLSAWCPLRANHQHSASMVIGKGHRHPERPGHRAIRSVSDFVEAVSTTTRLRATHVAAWRIRAETLGINAA